MEVSINKDTCTGCGLCAEDCPEVFEMQGDTAAVKVDEVPEKLEAKAKECAENCPVEAIQVE